MSGYLDDALLGADHRSGALSSAPEPKGNTCPEHDLGDGRGPWGSARAPEHTCGTMKPAPGTPITANVRLVEHLADGGMGSVWVGEHLTLERRVAVKVISEQVLEAGGDEVLARFAREAKAVAKIRSPHVVEIYDYGLTEDQTPYIVMEFVEGETLGERLDREGQLALSDVAVIVTQTAKALTAAHKLGIVHRDIKPDNIFLVDTDEEELFVKLLDFGIAKDAQAVQVDRLTGTRSVLGTPEYMSPEQLLTPKAVNYRADLWAVGAVGYHMVTGQVPFASETLAGLFAAITQSTSPPPSSVQPSLPPTLDAWFVKALAREPDDRFGSAKEMAAAFEAACGSTSRAVQTVGAAQQLQEAPATTGTIAAAPSVQSMATQPRGTEALQGAAPALVTPGVSQAVAAPAMTQPGPLPAQSRTLNATSATLAGELGPRGKVPRWLLIGGGTAIAVGVVAVILVAMRNGAEQSPMATATVASPDERDRKRGGHDDKPVPDVPTGMVAVAGGTYVVGCDKTAKHKCFPDERPAHGVELTAFAIMIHEVTMADYDQCVAEGVCPKPGKNKGCTWQTSGKERHPINCVPWHGADAYCKHRRWRLPTEQEWEAAARGPKGPEYPWGNELPSCKLTVLSDQGKAGCGGSDPLPVGSRPRDKSWAGAFDMGGNVREWTASTYAAYRGGDPDPERAGMINRGGSHLMRPEKLNAAFTRGVDPPEEARPGLGFRCAAEISERQP